MAKSGKARIVIRGVMEIKDKGDPTDPDEPGDGGEDGGGDGDGDGDGKPDPGPGAPYRRLDVVKVIALPEGEELPTHAPTAPGKLVIVRAGKRQGALAWLEKESDIPTTRDEGEAAPTNGHWVPVEPEEDVDEPEFAFVFHVDASFGMQGATQQPQPGAAPRRG